MSSVADVYATPQRTEQDVAADVVVRLMEGHLLLATAESIFEVSRVLRLPVPLIKAAWRRRQIPGAVSPPLRDVVVEPDAELETMEPLRPKYKPTYTEGQRRANEAKRAAKEPTPDTRTCSKCKKVKPKAEFSYKDKRTLTLRSMCKDCYGEYRQTRYLSSAKMKILGPYLRFIIEPQDEHAGSICPDCRQPCRPGDEVVAVSAVIHHADHFSEPK